MEFLLSYQLLMILTLNRDKICLLKCFRLVSLHDKYCMTGMPSSLCCFSWLKISKWHTSSSGTLSHGWKELNRFQVHVTSLPGFSLWCFWAPYWNTIMSSAAAGCTTLFKWWHHDVTFRALQCVSASSNMLLQNITMDSKISKNCELTIIAFCISPVIPKVGILFKIFSNASSPKTSTLKLRRQHELFIN